MNYQALVPVIGTVISIRAQSNDCCRQTLILAADQGQVHFIISPETVILNHTRLRPGTRLAAYYDQTLPVPLIYPPRYQAQFISTLRPGEQAYLGFFDRNLTAADQSLRLNIGPSTTVVTINGQPFSCTPGSRTLFVSYTNTTRSIPPQTTPRRVVVLC